MGITFKKQKRETGLAGVVHPIPCVDIKMDGKKFGIIYPPNMSSVGNYSEFWRIQFAVEKENWVYNADSPCAWKWISVKSPFSTENEARIFCQEKLMGIIERNSLTIHYWED
jgi:hypothetical protein